jgi:3-oxosteroid 1-dehydrogenase
VSLDETVDVLVVGSGMAGLCAALAAADHGLSTLVIDKADKVGGGSSWSNGGIWVGNNEIARREGIGDSREEAIAYLRYLGAGHAVEENLLSYVDGSCRRLSISPHAAFPSSSCTVCPITTTTWRPARNRKAA